MFHAFRKALFLGGLGGALLMLAAITVGKLMETTPRNANLALEKSTNEMLLLNIIRASQQKPMYFTGLSDVFMTDTAKLVGSLQPSVAFEKQSGFNVQILDNKEFINAILTPASLATLGIFLSFGWPAEFLLYMFTESVVAHGKRLPNVAYSVAQTKERYGAKAHDRITKLLAVFKGQVEHLARRPKVISVEYDGETYNVPAKENNLSMLSLNLISQLISLLKDPKNIPTSSTINIFAN